ncbi:MAG: YlxR family protein [Acidimicrobiales bacterium]
MTGAGGPRRTCIGCRRVRSTESLIRYVYGESRVLEGRTLSGRGAWLCSQSSECLDTAIRRGAFERALRRSLSVEQLAGLMPARRP